jgi:lysophospholipase L1-like esterase
VVIVALGSSSTSGAGASSPAHTYPAVLEKELRARFPANPITVVNRGVGGEDARQMLDRFSEGVIKEQPDLVIWQVGTNAVLRDLVVSGQAPLFHEGIARMKASQADVLLMDSQYAPKVLVKPQAVEMQALLANTAREERIGLFQRFAIMRHWVENDRVPFEAMLSPDLLHMNDWSYACIGKLVANAIADAVRSPAMAKAPRPTR